MKSKKWLAVVLCLILLFSCASLSAKPAVDSPAASASALADSSRILESRFLNMLNHNFAYDQGFDSEEGLIQSAALALRNAADEEGYLAESYVKDYLRDFYGLSVEDFSHCDGEFEHREGYVYVIPRGFSLYSHSIRSVTLNEDGSYTVITDVTISAHDQEKTHAVATTLFVKNAASRFGYQMVSSELTGTMALI